MTEPLHLLWHCQMQKKKEYYYNFFIYIFDVILQCLLESFAKAYFRTRGKGYQFSEKGKRMIQTWQECRNTKLEEKLDWVPLCFCGTVYQQKVFCLISSRDHSQRFSPSQVSDSLRLDFTEWSCVAVQPLHHYAVVLNVVL